MNFAVIPYLASDANAKKATLNRFRWIWMYHWLDFCVTWLFNPSWISCSVSMTKMGNKQDKSTIVWKLKLLTYLMPESGRFFEAIALIWDSRSKNNMRHSFVSWRVTHEQINQDKIPRNAPLNIDNDFFHINSRYGSSFHD